MYAWEPFFSDKIASIREEELKIRWRSAFWDTFLHFSWTVAPYIVRRVYPEKFSIQAATTHLK